MNIPESVIHRDIIIDGEHVAQVIENTLTNRRHDFITSEEKNFQFGSFFLSEGESIRSHQHLENRRSLKTTTEDEIKQAWKDLAFSFHPDRTGVGNEARRKRLEEN